MGAGISATAGGDGAFLLKDVEPGTYRRYANWLRSDFMWRAQVVERGADLKLIEAPAMQDIVLRLQPQAVITGRLTDTDGEQWRMRRYRWFVVSTGTDSEP